MQKDKHHLKPKHRGGNDADGLVEVTKTQHAMFHWCEWQLHGLQEDRIAWLALSGQLKAGEISAEKEALRISNMKGKKRTPEQCKRISEARKSLKGKIKRGKNSPEASKNQSLAQKKRFANHVFTEAEIQQRRDAQKKSSGMKDKKHTEESKRKTSETLRKRYGTL